MWVSKTLGTFKCLSTTLNVPALSRRVHLSRATGRTPASGIFFQATPDRVSSSLQVASFPGMDQNVGQASTVKRTDYPPLHSGTGKKGVAGGKPGAGGFSGPICKAG